MDPGATVRRDESSPEEVRKAAGDSARRFGKFIRLEQVGRGGWGEVWRAWETGLGRFVAIKTLMGSVEAEDRERFLREAQMAAKLAHPNIVAIHEQGRIDGIDYISMHYVAGQPLSKLRLPIREGLAVMRDAARAVEVAHQQGLVHRDLKPANIMVEEKTGRAYVLDFGLARSVREGASLSVSGTIMGTPAYMSPEQAEGHVHVDARADIYGLGATLYEVVTGQPPFVGESILDVLQKVQHEEPPAPRRLNPRLDADVETIILKAMEKESARRYATAAELAEEIDRFLRGDPITARPASTLYKLRKKIQRQPVAWALGASLVIAIAFGIIFGAIQVAKRQEALTGQLAAERAARRKERRLALIETARALTLKGDEMWADPTAPPEEARQTLKDAMRTITEGLREYPNDAEMMFWLGRANDSMWEDDEALMWYSRAIENNPNDAEARFYRARVRLRKYFETYYRDPRKEPGLEAERERLMKLMTEDLRAARKNPLARSESALADCYVMLADPNRRHELKARCAERAALGGRTEEYHALLGFVAEGENRWADAAIHYAAALERHPGEPRSWFHRGLTRENLGDYEGAIKDATKAIELKPNLAGAYNNRGSAKFKLGNFQDAIEDTTKAIELKPDLAEAYNNRGAAKDRLRDPQGAIQDYTKAIELKPNYADAFNNRGIVKTNLGDRRGAIQDYTKAIELDPGFAEAHYNRAVAKQVLEDYRGAIEDFTKAIEREPGSAMAYSGRGAAEGSLGDVRGAIEDTTTAIDLNPAYANGYFNRGLTLHALGRWAEALADFKKAVELRPDFEPKLRDRIRDCEEKIKKGEDF